MIINRSIFGKLNRITLSDYELLKASETAFDPGTCQCPHCKAKGRMRPITPYARKMISEDRYPEGHPPVVIIRRYECGLCGHSHALLGDVLIPYSSFTITYVLKVLYGYLTRPGRVDDYCLSIDISITTLYSWIHAFISHYNFWCKAVDRIVSLCASALDNICSSDGFLNDFISRFPFPFMSRKTNLSRPPSPASQPAAGGTA